MTHGLIGSIEYKITRLFNKLRSKIQGSHPKTNLLHPQWIMDRKLLNFCKNELAKLPSGSHILDVGCGSAPYWILNGNLIWQGIDVYKNDNTTYIVNPDGTYPIPSETFDSIICTQVFEHIFDFQTAVDEIFRVLKPGGKLIFNTPFLYPFHGMPHDFYRFTSSSINKIFEKYEIHEIGEIGGLGSTIGTLANNFWNYTITLNWKTRIIGIITWPLSLIFNMILNLLSFPVDFIDKTRSFPLNVYLIAYKPKN